jgi:hypothetical protein
VFEYGKMVHFGKKTVFLANFKDEEQMVGDTKVIEMLGSFMEGEEGFTVVIKTRCLG